MKTREKKLNLDFVDSYDVGIITKMSKNYGAVLQAFALKRIIESKNYNVRIINYNGAIGNSTYNTFLKPNGITNVWTNVLRLRHWKKIKESSRKFQKFRYKYFDLTKPYNSISELRKEPPKCKIYVVGSDQVWNPSILFSPIYFLDFGSKDVRRLSYAASFGKSNVHPDYVNEMQRLLFNLDYISVREKSGLDLLESMGISAEAVLDPTLVLEKKEWEKIAKEIVLKEKKYILCYFLHYDNRISEIVNEVKRMTGLKVINIATDARMSSIGDEQKWDVGPEEFVWLFQHAEVVLTSSFHGTAFSIIFERPFVTIGLNKEDSRLKNILEMTGLEKQIMFLEDKGIPCFYGIDYKDAKEKLEKLRLNSMEYLKKAMNE